jgi:hypothetical protein
MVGDRVKFFYVSSTQQRPSKPMSAVIGLGVSAMAAVMLMQKKNKTHYNTQAPGSACANAMLSETVSARVAETVEEAIEENDGAFDSLWGLSDEGEEQMRRASIPKSEEQSERVRLAKQAVQPMYVESLGTKGLGRTIPVIGRDMEHRTQPKVSGGCMFYMSDRYTRAMEDQ